jgi:hypothetical protein
MVIFLVEVGFNIFFDAMRKDHIDVVNKYEYIRNNFTSGMNFVSAKIKFNNRFLGLTSNLQYTGLAIGMNDEKTGVTI